MKSTTINAAIFLFSFFCVTVSLNAQNSFFVGPMATVHLSKYDATRSFADWSYFREVSPYGPELFEIQQDLDVLSKPGISGGVTVGIQLGKFSLISGARFSQKGTRYESKDFLYLDQEPVDLDYSTNEFLYGYDEGAFQATSKMNFIHIPLLARYQIGGENFAATLTIGPAFNIGVGEESTTWRFEGKLNHPSEQLTADGSYARSFGEDLNNFFKPMQTSFVISPGVMLPIGEQGKLHLTLNWETDLYSSINDTFRNRFSPNGDQRNKVFGFGISYEHHLDLSIGSKY